MAPPMRSPVSVAVPEGDGRAVSLAARGQELREAGRLADDDRQHAGGKRVEHAGVPDTRLAWQPTTSLRHRVMRRHAFPGLSTMRTPSRAGITWRA